MDPYRDLNSNAHGSEVVVDISPNRFPQYNESNCGYRCGWGCEPRRQDGSESDATPTLVGSEDEFEGESMEEVLPHDELEPPLPEDWPVLEDTDGNMDPIGMLSRLDEILHLDQLLQAGEDTESYYDESLDSMENEASSGAHSSVVSDRRSIGTVSPVGWDAGIGGWDEDEQAKQNPSKNYFQRTPLRLSPQYEHCRGHPASHMVTQDYSTLLELTEGTWRIRVPESGFAMWQHEGFRNDCVGHGGRNGA